MKQKFFKGSLGLFVTLAVLCSPLSVLAVNQSEDTESDKNRAEKSRVKSDTPGNVMMAPVNKEFLEYLQNPDDYSGVLPSSLDLDYLSELYTDSNLVDEKNLPQSYDMRDYGLAPSVRDQGVYGTCWAMATTSSMASGVMDQFPTVSFSPVHLNWFSYNGDIESEMLEKYLTDDSIFNYGGNASIATPTLAAWKGPVLSEKLPYSFISEYNSDLSQFEYMRYDADFHLQDSFYVSPDVSSENGRDILKSALIEYGCATISYCSNDEYYNSETNAQFCPDEAPADHAVLIVGWDDNYSRENFNEDYRPENDGAWLIQNSWGTEYNDEGGYFWLSYEDKSIDETTIRFFQLEDADNYQNNYQYDVMGWQTSLGNVIAEIDDSVSKTFYGANVFTSKDDEQLEAVSFYTTDLNTEYQISIYTDPIDGDPASGNLVYSGKTGVEPFVGYHTEELENAVRLDKGTQFSVVVKFTNPNYAYPVAASTSYSNIRKDKIEHFDNQKYSFISSDGESWGNASAYFCDYDYAGESYGSFTTCVCIKAFTNPLPSDKEAISNVRFSQLEGPVELGTELRLEGEGTINYQIDGGAVQIYNSPIKLDKPCTVTAWGEEDGKIGNKVSRTYTMASAQLSALTYSQGDKIHNVEISDDGTGGIFLNKTGFVKLHPESSDNITINGKHIDSNEWSEEFTLAEGEDRKEVVIEVSGEGKNTTTYTINLIGDINFDYEKETVIYPEDLYDVRDSEGKIIHSGDIVSDYSVIQYGELSQKFFSVKSKENGKFLGEIPVPLRFDTAASGIDVENENTFSMYSDKCFWSSSKDNFTEIHWCENDKIKLEPGQTYRIYRNADDQYRFASDVFEFEIAERHEKPAVSIEGVNVNYVSFVEDENCEYRLSGGEWQDSPQFYELDPNTSYTFEVRYKAGYDNEEGTKMHFASEPTVVTVETADGIITQCKYIYHGREFQSLDYGLSVGTNTIDVYEDLLLSGDMGLIPAEGQEDVIVVNLSNENGKYVADRDIVVNVEMVEYDDDGNQVPVSSDQYDYMVYLVDDSKKVIDVRTYSFTTPLYVQIEDLQIPEGYIIADDSDIEEGYVPVLLFVEGVWRTFGTNMFLPVQSVGESSEVQPSEEPSEPSEVQPSEEPSEPSEVQPSEEPSEPSEVQPSEEPSEPSEVQPSEEPSEPSEVQPSKEPSEPSDVQPSEEPSEPSEVQPSVIPVEPSGDNPSDPFDNQPPKTDGTVSTDEYSQSTGTDSGEDSGTVQTGDTGMYVQVIVAFVVTCSTFCAYFIIRRKKVRK